jgi:hypothetical protein
MTVVSLNIDPATESMIYTYSFSFFSFFLTFTFYCPYNKVDKRTHFLEVLFTVFFIEVNIEKFICRNLN